MKRSAQPLPSGAATNDGLEAERGERADPEDPDEYRAVRIFWVPPDARWSHIQTQAPQPTIGETVDRAMIGIEADNLSLKSVLPKAAAGSSRHPSRCSSGPWSGNAKRNGPPQDANLRESGCRPRPPRLRRHPDPFVDPLPDRRPEQPRALPSSLLLKCINGSMFAVGCHDGDGEHRHESSARDALARC